MDTSSSSSESDVDSFTDSDFSESDLEDYEVEIENEVKVRNHEETEGAEGSGSECYDESAPYSGEPLADEEWIKQYEKEMEEEAQQEEINRKRLSGIIPVSEWCTCGNCSTNALHNINECYCCKELDGCVEALESELVLQDLQDGTVLNCITKHPGFEPVCLQKWSLRLASDKYRTKERKRYRQTGSEDR